MTLQIIGVALLIAPFWGWACCASINEFIKLRELLFWGKFGPYEVQYGKNNNSDGYNKGG